MTVTVQVDTTRLGATLINVFTVSPDRQDELIERSPVRLRRP
ncbi:hypothetical protein [Streptomyces durhamensis]|nr:hypothetical protein [Streptomyces durhamensis]